jgi:hypothetical protein
VTPLFSDAVNGTPIKDHEPNGNGAWWKPALAAVGAIVAGAAITWTGLQSRLDSQEAAVRSIQQEQRQERKIDRIDDKLDELLRRK